MPSEDTQKKSTTRSLVEEAATAPETLVTLLEEADAYAKLLVQTDRKLTRTQQQLHDLSGELEETAKTLVRRDLELSEANTRLRALDQAKSEFVSVAAHQLRTPLTGIRWTFQALLRDKTNELTNAQKRILTEGQQATQNAITLVNNLLNVARIEESGMSYTFSTENLLPHLHHALARIRPNAEHKGITIETALPETLPSVQVDVEKLHLVYDNVLDNAVKYTEPGGVIRCSLTATETNVIHTFSDTGIGIPKAQQHRIFSKFFRAKNAQLLETSGSGLGLYVVQQSVERHAGSISITSASGEGTTVTITLPRSDASGAPVTKTV